MAPLHHIGVLLNDQPYITGLRSLEHQFPIPTGRCDLWNLLPDQLHYGLSERRNVVHLHGSIVPQRARPVNAEIL
jgi:hypothetical protein